MTRKWLPLLFLVPALLCGATARARPRSLEQRAVKSKDPLVREAAVQVLGARGSATSVPLLIERLSKDDNLWVRARAAEALGRMGAPSAIRPLRTALSREKKQRVRRMVAMALVRLGQRTGVEELMWQMKAGTNHAKAEVMEFFTRLFGEPLGQQVKAWWAYLSRTGYKRLARRPVGAGALLELPGLEGNAPVLFGSKTGWHQVPAVVLTLPPTRVPVTAARLRALDRRAAIPDGVLLLVRTRWREARIRAPKQAKRPAAPRGPGLTLEAARYLLQRAPRLLGVGIDAPSLDPPGGQHPVRDLLLSGGRLALEGVDHLDRINPAATRLVLVDRGAAPTGGRTVLLLAMLP